MADYDLQYQDTHIDALLATANELKTAGYIYKGVATPSTNPGTPTERVAYLASEPGTYTNFGGIVITRGLYSLTYAGGTWTGTQISAGSDIEVVQTIGDSTTDVMSQKAVCDELNISKTSFYDASSSTAYGYINTAGSVVTGQSSSPYRYSDYLTVKEGDILILKSAFSTSVAIVATFDSNKTFKSSIAGKGTSSEYELTYTVPAGIAYVKISSRISGIISSAEIITTSQQLLARGNRIALTIQTLKQNYGYITNNGGLINSGSTWAYTYPIKVREGDIVEFLSYSAASSAAIAAYTSNNLQVASSTQSGQDNYGLSFQRYTVANGVDFIRITHKYSVDGDISIKIYRKTEHELTKKTISILFVGNSLTQDAIMYMPLLIRELAPEIDFKFYQWYNGGYTLAQHLAKWQNNETCAIFSRCENGCAWINQNNSVKMSEILSTYQFDILCLQEYFNYKETYTASDLQTYNDCIAYVREHYNKPFKVATLFHAPKRDVAESVFNLTKNSIKTILQQTITDILNPAGISIYRALSTDLDSLGDQGHLSPDGTHAQEGLPCMMEAYVSALWILDMLGIPKSVADAQTLVTDNNYTSLNVAGPNLGTGVVVGTVAQVDLSQDVAIKAWKEGKKLLNENLSQY